MPGTGDNIHIPLDPAEAIQPKRRYQRVVIGVLLLLAKLAQFIISGPNETMPGTTPAYRTGAYIGDALMLALIVWLITSGLKPKLPKGAKP